MPEKSGMLVAPCAAAPDDSPAGAKACPKTGVTAADKVISNSKPWLRFILASRVAAQSLRKNSSKVKSKNGPSDQGDGGNDPFAGFGHARPAGRVEGPRV